MMCVNVVRDDGAHGVFSWCFHDVHDVRATHGVRSCVLQRGEILWSMKLGSKDRSLYQRQKQGLFFSVGKEGEKKKREKEEEERIKEGSVDERRKRGNKREMGKWIQKKRVEVKEGRVC